MENTQAIAAVQNLINTNNYANTVLQAALTILQNGYQSDEEANATAISAGIASGVASAVSDAVAPLNTQIDTLTASLATANTQITTLLAVGGFPDFPTFQAAQAAGFTNNADYQASLVTPAVANFPTN